ncbi:hypothetical protein SEPCBS119000_003747 [Sporothrix epigloea]|uniref:Thioesterase TesA-like domain-containing protein n=1 Tax=Sporothrix epigloea TaxID=1892477 RepID=A0ABP0DS05_9PEZI
MFEADPHVIQAGPRHPIRHHSIPLILIHDGGGTTFSYHLVGDLNRTVLGIANPRFRSGIPWAGGLREMATAYAASVEGAVSSGPVILGGWSLGGLLAMEIAHVLSQNCSGIHVAGLILIDSVYPARPEAGWADIEKRLTERTIEWAATTSATTKLCVERCFREAHRMVREWKPPVSPLPRSVLVRCRDAVPAPGDGLLFVDIYRKEQRLGWDNYREDVFSQVLETPGHHYNVFAPEHVETVTVMIKTACTTIEKMDGMFALP